MKEHVRCCATFVCPFMFHTLVTNIIVLTLRNVYAFLVRQRRHGRCEQLAQLDIVFSTPDFEDVPRSLIEAAQKCDKDSRIKSAMARREATKVIRRHFSELRKLSGDDEPVRRAKERAKSCAGKILHALSVHLPHRNGFYSSLRSKDVTDEATLIRVVEAIKFTKEGNAGMTASEDDVLTKEFGNAATWNFDMSWCGARGRLRV